MAGLAHVEVLFDRAVRIGSLVAKHRSYERKSEVQILPGTKFRRRQFSYNVVYHDMKLYGCLSKYGMHMVVRLTCYHNVCGVPIYLMPKFLFY